MPVLEKGEFWAIASIPEHFLMMRSSKKKKKTIEEKKKGLLQRKEDFPSVSLEDIVPI